MAKKRLLILIMCIASVFVFVGCSNVEYQRVVDDSGMIVDKITVELKEQEIISKMGNAGFLMLKNDIEQDFDKYEIQSRNRINYLVMSESDDRYYTAISIVASDWTRNTDGVWSIFIRRQFANSDYLNIFLNRPRVVVDAGEDEGTVVSDLFLSKYIMETDSVYNKLEEISIDNVVTLFDKYSSKYTDFSIEDVSLTEVYGSTDDRLKSNANYKTTIDGINYHLWEVDTKNENYKNMKLQYYYVTAVGTGWYIVALAITLAVTIILIAVCILRKIKSKKYKQLIYTSESKDEE